MASGTPLRRRRRIGIVGFGAVGKYLATAVTSHPLCRDKLELAFVWEPMDPSVVRNSADVPAEAVLDSVDEFADKRADLIIEVAHPSISEKYGVAFLQHADYMPASTTAFADAKIESALRAEAEGAATGHGMYIPSGALWGARDVQKMSQGGSLKGLCVTMKKAPHHLKVYGSVLDKMEAALAKGIQGETVLYDGPVRDLAPLAPNNVNTIAAAALAAPNLGFDGVQARLVMDPALQAHVVEVDVSGPGAFRVCTNRFNPAQTGAVTGDATYASFMASMLEAHGKGDGLHFC